jgi:hypothetical protein
MWQASSNRRMAEATVNTLTLTLKSGWLQNLELPDDTIGIFPAVTNVNTISTAAVVQFTPIGSNSVDSQHPLLNAGFQGSNGTWPSSNPLVMSVNQQGLASATTWGTTIIRDTSRSGVNFSEWLMYITAQ